jgi:recombination protein RecA
MSSRHRKLDMVVERLQLEHGQRAIFRAAVSAAGGAPRISTTFTRLDAALAEGGGGSGLPRGRISEIAGAATSGKVTVAAKVLSAAQAERGALVAWIDGGRNCDPDYLHRCGIDLDRLLVVHPTDGSDALGIAIHLAGSSTLAALVVDMASPPLDSAAAGVGRWREARGGQDFFGALEQLALVVGRSKTAVLFLTEPGFFTEPAIPVAAVRLRISRERWIVQRGDVCGYEGAVEILKNRPGRAGAVIPLRITFNGTVRGDGL